MYNNHCRLLFPPYDWVKEENNPVIQAVRCIDGQQCGEIFHLNFYKMNITMCNFMELGKTMC